MRELQKCEDCGTEFIVACGPPGCIAVPACRCAIEKRKAERQVAYEGQFDALSRAALAPMPDVERP